PHSSCTECCPLYTVASQPLREGRKDRYLRALPREFDLLAGAPWRRTTVFETVFLGGGTPSLLEPAELARVLDGLRARFRIEADAEVTVECNPESVSRAKPEAYRTAGATRGSLRLRAPVRAAPG